MLVVLWVLSCLRAWSMLVSVVSKVCVCLLEVHTCHWYWLYVKVWSYSNLLSLCLLDLGWFFTRNFFSGKNWHLLVNCPANQRIKDAVKQGNPSQYDLNSLAGNLFPWQSTWLGKNQDFSFWLEKAIAHKWKKRRFCALFCNWCVGKFIIYFFFFNMLSLWYLTSWTENWASLMSVPKVIFWSSR